MINQMQQSIKSCMHCLQHKGDLPKVSLHPVAATISLDLLHIDFTSKQMTMDLNKPPRAAIILVFHDHFTKHILAYMTPDQTAKTITKLLYQGYILIFRALARLLSDWSASLWTASLMNCVRSSVWRNDKPCLTTPKLIIMRMIGKLGEDKKANWPGHLAEIVHTYNATQSTVMAYSPHYLMFRWRPRLPVDFYFPTFRSAEAPTRDASAKCMDKYVATVHYQLKATLQEVQPSQQQKPSDRNGTTTER